MPLLVNTVATTAIALMLLLNAEPVPECAMCFACLPVGAFLIAGLQSVAPTELRRDVAAALNGACMLAASGLALMCMMRAVHVPSLAAVSGAAAALAGWNVFRFTEPDAPWAGRKATQRAVRNSPRSTASILSPHARSSPAAPDPLVYT